MDAHPRSMRLPDNSVVLQYNDAETSLQFRKIVTERMYVRHGISIPRGGTVVDVGANIGLASLFFAAELGSGRVVAVEPADHLFQALSANLAEHSRPGVHATAHNVALGAEAGSAYLTVYPNNTSMSSIYADGTDDRDVTRTYLHNAGFTPADVTGLMSGLHDSYRTSCRVVTLSSLIDDCGLTAIDLLKINVEKAELDVLDGLDSRHWPMVRQVVVQVHDLDGRVAALQTRLEGLGFACTVTQDDLLHGTNIFDLYGRAASTTAASA